MIRSDYRALTCTYPPNQEPDDGLRSRVRALETVAVQLQLFLVKLVEERLRLPLQSHLALRDALLTLQRVHLLSPVLDIACFDSNVM